MGKTLQTLAHIKVPHQAVFNNRFCIEACERFHIHYRNLRISLSTSDFIELCKGCIQAFERWNARGCPENPKVHIELCRKQIAKDALNEGIRINLNENLYNAYKEKIFSEGSNFEEPTYIHLKMRDMRIEMSLAEFKELADAIEQARKKLNEIPLSMPTMSEGAVREG